MNDDNNDANAADNATPPSAAMKPVVGQSSPAATRPTVTARPSAPAALKLALELDNSVVNDWTVTGTEQKPGVYEYRLGVPSGTHRFAVVNRRFRGGADELLMKNGRIGREQNGVVWVKWVEIQGPISGATTRYPAAQLATSGTVHDLPGGGRLLGHGGEVAATFHVERKGDYILRAQAYADQAGNEPARMEWRINGKAIKTFDVTAPAKLVPIEGQRVFSTELLNALPYVYEQHVTLDAGPQNFSAAFVNDFADPKNENPNLRQRDLYINYLEVVNVDGVPPLPPIPAELKRNFTAEPTALNKPAAAREILANFTYRAWRRPVQESELDGLTSLFEKADTQGESFLSALKLPMKAVLISPYFLFQGEIQHDPDNPKAVYSLDDFALASRLSYFLWSSMPDDELLDLAKRGQLHAHLTEQVRRMLASPRAQALVDDFSGQWLQTRNLKFVAPDKKLYPDYDPALGEDMRKETSLFFNAVMREDHSVLDFLTGDYTFVNERLAAFYGLPNVHGDDFQRVSLEGTPRRGILTQGSVLTITSNPTRTSPVKRGKWVLENILNAPPPPPPPDVPELKDDGRTDKLTLRQQMEAHRANPACASCHARMDPLGFGLENFDGVGQWRAKEGAQAVDASGQLDTGEKFTGAVELTKILASQQRQQFLDCLASKMLTYAIGRGMEPYDDPAIDGIVAGMKQDDLKFSSLILNVVNSVPFQMRRGEASLAAAN